MMRSIQHIPHASAAITDSKMRMCSVSVLSSRERIGEIQHLTTMEAWSPLSRARGKKKLIKTQKRCKFRVYPEPRIQLVEPMVLGPGGGFKVKYCTYILLAREACRASDFDKIKPFGVQIHRQYGISRPFEIVEALLRCIRKSLSVVEIWPGVRGQGLGDLSL